jgi:hypothetical protein
VETLRLAYFVKETPKLASSSHHMLWRYKGKFKCPHNQVCEPQRPRRINGVASFSDPATKYASLSGMDQGSDLSAISGPGEFAHKSLGKIHRQTVTRLLWSSPGRRLTFSENSGKFSSPSQNPGSRRQGIPGNSGIFASSDGNVRGTGQGGTGTA